MREFIGIGLPIVAILISIISLRISISNSKFKREFDTAKKKTELITKMLSGIKILKNDLFQLQFINSKCKNCDECELSFEQEILGTKEMLHKLEVLYEKAKRLNTDLNPIQIEKLIADFEGSNIYLDSYANLFHTMLKIIDCDVLQTKAAQASPRPPEI